MTQKIQGYKLAIRHTLYLLPFGEVVYNSYKEIEILLSFNSFYRYQHIQTV